MSEIAFLQNSLPADCVDRTEDAEKFLNDLRRNYRGSVQAEIADFADLVLDAIAAYPDCRASGKERAFAEFLSKSVALARHWEVSGSYSSETLAELQDQAVHFASLASVVKDVWSGSWLTAGPPAICVEEGDGEEEDLVAPGADEIASILASLTRGGEFVQAVDQKQDASSKSESLLREPPDTSLHGVVPTAQSKQGTDLAHVTLEQLDPELRDAFLDDASTCLVSMEDAVLKLETNPGDPDSLGQLCRQLHTLKGAAGSVGLSEMADRLHQLEDRLQEVRDAGQACDVSEVLAQIDAIRAQCSFKRAARQEHENASHSDVSSEAAVDENASFSERSFGEASDDESVRVKSSQLNRLMDMLAELLMLRNRRETEVSELQEIYHELIGSVSKMRMLCHEEGSQSSATNSLQLSEVANDVLEIAQSVRSCTVPVAEGNRAVSNFIRQFRKELVELRRTPIGGLFRRLQRVARDAARAEAKQVKLQLIGEDEGIERALQQRLYEPLLHIVRNCVCHGVESPEKRAECGKVPQGTITVRAEGGPDLFVIEIQDDGRGLDYEAIRRRGIEKGLLDAKQSVSRDELAQLIFHPGFSTRVTADQMAGRGVGMDVVSSTLQRLRGWLDIESEPLQGTRIRLNLPVPSLIQHVMVFRSAGQLFALPMQCVRSAGESSGNTQGLSFASFFDSASCSSGGNGFVITLANETKTSQTSLLSPQCRTIFVDEILGPEEVVVRPLPAILKHHPFCVGATLSGTGKAVLVLDARRIMEAGEKRRADSLHHRTRNNQRSDVIPAPTENRNLAEASNLTKVQVLVVDDSISARKRVVRSLRRYAVDITEASNGRDALALLKTRKFDAIFTDLEMPHITGLELLAEVQARHGDAAPPVTIISSRSEEEFTSRAKQLGVQAYLLKPLSDQALDGALSEIRSLRHLNPIQKDTFCMNGDIT